jgi:hypothetical protein
MTNLAPTLDQSRSHMAGQLRTAADCRRFAEAGNAVLTLQSARTGTRFTYRVRKSEDGSIHFVSLLNGPDNGSNYSYFGYIRRGVFFHGGQKARVGRDAPSAKAFDYFWRAVSQDVLPAALEVWHEGRCCRCARRLTVPGSIALGIGPECAERMGVATLARDFQATEVLGEDQ